MGENSASDALSFILLLLAILFFVMPIFFGADSISGLFLLSFALLIGSFLTSVFALAESGSGLALFSFIVSIVFLLFLFMGMLVSLYT